MTEKKLLHQSSPICRSVPRWADPWAGGPPQQPAGGVQRKNEGKKLTKRNLILVQLISERFCKISLWGIFFLEI